MQASLHRCIGSDRSLLAPVLQEHWSVGSAFCQEQCCSAPVLRHRTVGRTTSLHRCICSDTSLLATCLAQQHWSVRSAFCQEQYYSALCRVTAQLYEQQVFIGVFAVTQACWRPVLHSSTGQWGVHSAKNRTRMHCVGSMHSCMNSKSS